MCQWFKKKFAIYNNVQKKRRLPGWQERTNITSEVISKCYKQSSMLTPQDEHDLCCQNVARALGNLAQGVNLGESIKVA